MKKQVKKPLYHPVFSGQKIVFPKSSAYLCARF
jgi:hypothetical protein